MSVRERVSGDTPLVHEEHYIHIDASGAPLIACLWFGRFPLRLVCQKVDTAETDELPPAKWRRSTSTFCVLQSDLALSLCPRLPVASSNARTSPTMA